VRVATDRDQSRPAGGVPAGAGLASVGLAGDPLRANLALMAPGTALRDGLERILRGRTGALIVLGYDRVVESLCTGGFPLDVEFSATRLRELCKMDGAVVLSSEGTRILRAAVHLMPDPGIPTEESGTRHRTAERVAKQTGFPVISVSQSMHIIGLYLNGQRHVLDDSAAIMSKANQALATLERYKLRLDEVSGTLSALEIEDLVTTRDAVTVVQRLEMVRRIADEIAGYVVELGTDGRLLALQLDELMAGVDADRTLVVRDYLPAGRPVEEALHDLDLLSAADLLDLVSVAKSLGHRGSSEGLETPVSPRGLRLLAKVPRLPGGIVDRLVDHFGNLQRLLGATVEDLQTVGGIGDTRARAVREGLSRLAEASILERYV
jgi:diadenylate cyclase